ncbi:hypothetical protein N9N67_07625 [Bacteriovoracaceae bacterium]|nr:hypothetical protein [Bacteriovoracaceae bacterium]
MTLLNRILFLLFISNLSWAQNLKHEEMDLPNPQLGFIEGAQIRLSADSIEAEKSVGVRFSLGALSNGRVQKEFIQQLRDNKNSTEKVVAAEQLNYFGQHLIKLLTIRSFVYLQRKYLNKFIKAKSSIKKRNKTYSQIFTLESYISDVKFALRSNQGQQKVLKEQLKSTYQLTQNDLDRFKLPRMSWMKNKTYTMANSSNNQEKYVNGQLRILELKQEFDKANNRKLLDFVEVKKSYDGVEIVNNTEFTVGLSFPLDKTSPIDIEKVYTDTHKKIRLKNEAMELGQNKKLLIIQIRNEIANYLELKRSFPVTIKKLKKQSINTLALDEYLKNLKFEYDQEVRFVEHQRQIMELFMEFIKLSDNSLTPSQIFMSRK